MPRFSLACGAACECPLSGLRGRPQAQKKPPRGFLREGLKSVARPARFERTAFGSGGQRSIRLSYGRTRVFLGKGRAAVKPCPPGGTSRHRPGNGPRPFSRRDAARHRGRAASFRDNLLVLRYNFTPRSGGFHRSAVPPNKENNHEPDPLVRPFGLQYQL